MPGSNYLVARSLDRATDESSSARRVSFNGSEAARLTTYPTDDPLLVARPTLPMSWTPASLLSRWKRFQSLSRRPFFARDTNTRPFKSRRTFNALNRVAVRVSLADPRLTPLQPHPWQHKPHDQATSVLIYDPVSPLPSTPSQQRAQPQPRQHSIPDSIPNKTPSEQ